MKTKMLNCISGLAAMKPLNDSMSHSPTARIKKFKMWTTLSRRISPNRLKSEIIAECKRKQRRITKMTMSL